MNRFNNLKKFLTLKPKFTYNGSISSIKSIREFIKYTIIIGGLLMSIHCGFLLLGMNLAVINFIFGISVLGYVILFLSTYLLGFCNNIRWLLTYIFTVRCCVSYQIYFGFGLLLLPLRVIMMCIGLCLIFKTLYNAYIEGLSVEGIIASN